MTEKEKMIRGELYDPQCPTLKRDRLRAKSLCYQYNQLPPSEEARRAEILKTLFGSVQSGIHIEPTLWCDYGYNITVGENFYANHNLVILDVAPVHFGDNVMVACNCGFYTATHPIDAVARKSGREFALPITVGDDVWIGSGAQVLPGVIIGSNVVIGAGSVVSKDIPDHSVAVGNPCRVIRTLSPIEAP